MPFLLMRASACGYFREAEIDDQRDYIAVRWRFCDSRTHTVRVRRWHSSALADESFCRSLVNEPEKRRRPFSPAAGSSSMVKVPIARLWRS
jgi:hypothetical protein